MQKAITTGDLLIPSTQYASNGSASDCQIDSISYEDLPNKFNFFLETWGRIASPNS